jgi:hypothetical protein
VNLPQDSLAYSLEASPYENLQATADTGFEIE